MAGKRKNRKSHAHVRSPSSGDIKISEAILRLAKPLMDRYGEDRKRLEAIITLAIIAWNNALLPVHAQRAFAMKSIETLSPRGGDAELTATVTYLLEQIEERRKKLFPHPRAFIVSFDVQESVGTYTLNVCSMPLSGMPEHAEKGESE
jgi:hypothetical protein